MRVIAGKHKGRRLSSFHGAQIRPTSDRVKEGIFNVLGQKISGSRVLDLFSGTGNLGVEALSRGAYHVTFVDRSSAAIKLIYSNLELIGENQKSYVIKGNVRAVIAKLARESAAFDIVFVDPPYRTVPHEDIIHALVENSLLAPDAVIVYETERECEFVEQMQGIKSIKWKLYGDTRVTFLENDLPTG